MVTPGEIQDTFSALLQRDIVINLKKRVYRKGRVLLFSQKDFYLYFVLLNEKDEQKQVELPYPFGVEVDNEQQQIIIDYTLETFCRKNYDIYYRALILKKNDTKFFDKKIVIQW